MGTEDDLRLLRAYEPAARFTQGEYFFPVSAERYVNRAGLWRLEAGESPVQQVAPGGLTLDGLAGAGGPAQGLQLSLSGIGNGHGRLGTAHIPLRERPAHLRRSSRLASVGLMARFIDTANRISLLFRGRVPGGSAAHSFLLQRDHLEPERPIYYGRVLRDDPWIVCQYWYFYSFNNWRSAFGGVNEHEADWEQVTIYLDGTGETGPGELPPPRWVVFSAHDEIGDDLRRRWDDPDLTLVDGRHPVVYVGAGSHSGAYLPGDYLITVRPPSLRGVVGALRWSARLFAPWAAESRQGVGIPYVDYARGDGRAVGPGQPEAWRAVVIGDDTDWVRDFRGLWGRDTRDRLGGERGPAGPRYERDGTARQSWADPVGWAGLAKVAPSPEAERALVEQRRRENDDRLVALDTEITRVKRELALAAAGLPVASPEVRALHQEERRLLGLRMERTRLADEQARTVMAETVTQPPHAHLMHRRLPMEAAIGFRGRLRSWWAVLSTPLILVAGGLAISPLATGGFDLAVVWLLGLLCVEGLVRGKFLAVLLRLLLAAAAIALMVVLWFEGRYIVAFVLFAAAAGVLLVNVREAWRR
ncbi:hypothetical protein JIG36_35360 [Actinoplanes sp. LDG1-06]|uniref:Uncharacterized protein n=1 Tax=Paractinoplanes ovalisporus TaxID=2810368 RepID=A0ABS2ALQ1_9ACTN|nr:hypothetical protein [Actinoplanes ovalisporus]MBM2620792.1 hypothetical protein [Actinoplanes ovalisporus]